ncbi:MAG: hypothetical protein HBSIN02_20740 [Bacteroidia bacterium]|nr:MAG: hypothetical protein HBSIN02_20740 [Bacteroidia bacterium]
MGEKKYDLEERTAIFARRGGAFVNGLPRTLTNLEYGRQLVRAAASIGANYIEANEALGRKDFFMHLRISKKEAKESLYWLNLVECDRSDSGEKDRLIREATELMNIFGAIIRNST